MMDTEHTNTSPSPTSLTRRSFLGGAAAFAGSIVLGSCLSEDRASNSTSSSSRPPSVPKTAASSSAIEHRPNVNPYLAGNFAPVAAELTETALQVRGRLPQALNGRYIRTGPNPMEVPNPARHPWFPGDGMMHGIELRDGTAVSYRNRYARTSSVTTRFGEPAVGGPAQPGLDSSNTNIVPFRGSVLSITEGALPYVIGPELNTIERIDFGGLSHGLSAHCKYDPIARELHNVSYRVAPAPFAVWQVIDAEGRVVRDVPIELETCGMWHTFSLTERYVILYDMPVVFSQQRIDDGWYFPFAWDPNHPSRVGLLERTGDGTVDWIEMEQCAINHDDAAIDTPTGVSVYATISERIFDKDPAGPLESQPFVERLDIDVTSRNVRRSSTNGITGEFLRAHPDLWASPARYIYSVGNGPGKQGGGVLESGNSVIKFDATTGTTDLAKMGAGRATSEAVFVPDPDRSADEDGGWLLSYVYDAATDLSEFVVIDAQDLAAGPVASVQLPTRVPFGFHGNWIPS